MQTIFFDDKGQIRSGWRIVVFITGYFLAVSLTAAVAFAVFGFSETITPVSMAVNALIVLIPALIVGSLSGKLLERLPFSAIGIQIGLKSLKTFLTGSVTGIATLMFAVAIAMAFGGLSFSWNAAVRNDVWTALGVPLLVFAVAAAAEEALFRGYVFQTLTRSGYAWLAILITSVPFGLAHLRNPNAGVISTINTVLAGVWFGLAYLKTRDLWFVWGMHWFWNWTQGSVFGIEVSGLTGLTATPLLIEQDNGPQWLTGTTYGIEGGTVCTIAIVISMGLIYFLPSLQPVATIPAPTTDN